MDWRKKLTAEERTHVRQNCVPLEGLHSKALVIERARVSANRGCHECQAVLSKLEKENKEKK